ncbi:MULTISPECIES: RNA polymerase sigma factor [Pacificimonas]|uniref:RNA polymerase sigma factor n=1 Tax=Pacificimonas TaxID=1960290 RepID=UPI001CCB0797|nr:MULTISPECIES: sigma-70 family RNA polymerase sigma factor [Pacificimonas]
MTGETISDQVRIGRKWRPALMSYFLRRVRDHNEAEDLTQEVFVRLLARHDEVESSSDAYVFQVASNLLRDRARRAKVRADYRQAIGSAEGLGVEPLDPHRVAAGRDALKQLVAGLETLPERTRTIFVLYRIENMGLDVIADSFGISKSAVKKHVHKAMTVLMRRLRASR